MPASSFSRTLSVSAMVNDWGLTSLWEIIPCARAPPITPPPMMAIFFPFNIFSPFSVVIVDFLKDLSQLMERIFNDGFFLFFRRFIFGQGAPCFCCRPPGCRGRRFRRRHFRPFLCGRDSGRCNQGRGGGCARWRLATTTRPPVGFFLRRFDCGFDYLFAVFSNSNRNNSSRLFSGSCLLPRGRCLRG